MEFILRAPGFAKNLVSWWEHRVLVVGDPESVPLEPPGACCATAILSAMQLEVRNLETPLNRSRIRRVTKQRSSGLTHLYASVRRDAPVPVDVLVESRQSTVDVVDHADCALELRAPVAFVPDRPVVCNGRQLGIIVATEDKLYVDSVHDCRPGDTVCQTVCTGNLDLVFQAFTEQWRSRWNKHSGLLHTHWDSLFAFAAAKLGHVQAEGPSFAPTVLRAVATSKKAKAAIGLDGVSRWDILNLVPSELQSLTNLFRRAHDTGDWPQQLLQGQVKSLAKKFSFAYRLWSSISSQYWLKNVSPVLDSRLCGNRATVPPTFGEQSLMRLRLHMGSKLNVEA